MLLAYYAPLLLSLIRETREMKELQRRNIDDLHNFGIQMALERTIRDAGNMIKAASKATSERTVGDAGPGRDGARVVARWARAGRHAAASCDEARLCAWARALARVVAHIAAALLLPRARRFVG